MSSASRHPPKLTALPLDHLHADVVVLRTGFAEVADAAPVELIAAAGCGRRATVAPDCRSCQIKSAIYKQVVLTSTNKPFSTATSRTSRGSSCLSAGMVVRHFLYCFKLKINKNTSLILMECKQRPAPNYDGCV